MTHTPESLAAAALRAEDAQQETIPIPTSDELAEAAVVSAWRTFSKALAREMGKRELRRG